MKIRKTYDIKTLVFKIFNIFLMCFLQNRCFFWQNTSMRAEIFSWKIGKKGNLIVFLWRITEFSFERTGVFLNNYVHNSVGFSPKNWKKSDMRVHIFWESRRFVCVQEPTCLLTIGRWNDKIWASEQWFYYDISWKKGILLTFLAHNIRQF